MGRFESYPETDALNDNDITLYNHTNNTNKITFINLVNLIKTKLQSIGIIAIDTGVGLSSDGTITSNGTIKCDLKSETPASISSANISTVDNRQYAVGVDKDGHLSVNVPWEGGSSTTYVAGSGINIINNTISTKLKSNTQSLLTASSMGSTSNRQYAVGLDSQNYLSVNIPWVEYSADKGIILNNNSHNLSANLKSYTQSSLTSTSMGATANRQYAVGLDKDGYLSVNIPWEGGSTTYTAGSGINISNNIISTKLKSYTQSSLSSASMGSTANRQYAVGLDSSGNLSVNVPWENTLPNVTGVKGNSESTYRTGNVNITAANIGLGNVGNYKAVSTVANQGLTDTEKANARANIGAGTSSFSGSYTDLTNKPTIPTVNNATLTIQKNGTNVQTFTANQSSNATANITVPTKTSELTNDSGYTTNTGTVTRVQTGVGLVGDITTSGTIKTKLKSETASTLSSTSMGSTSNRQYAVGLDKDGYLSVNIPWDSGMLTDGSNADSEVVFSGKFTVGSRKANTTHGVNSVAEGVSVAAEGNYSHAEGYSTTASGAYSHAEGQGTTASGSSSHAEGSYGVASGMGSHVEGGILKGAPIALGLYESQDNNTKIGRTSDNSFISGKIYYLPPFIITPMGDENPKAMKWLELQSGNTYIYTTDTTVNSSKTYYNCDIIFGGTYSQTAKGYFSHSEGNYTIANGNYAHTEGQKTKAEGSASHAEGYNTLAEGIHSHAEGYNAVATGEISHAEGKNTITIGAYSHAEGEGTAAGYDHQHVNGKFNSNKSTTLFEVGNGSSSNRSNAFEVYSDGSLSTDNGTTQVKLENLALKSEIPDTSVFMTKSNPQGTGNFSLNRKSGTTIGNYSFAEGSNTTASGNYSHAEGVDVIASGNYSHAEGYYTTASGNASHAEGNYSVASGMGSHVEGGVLKGAPIALGLYESQDNNTKISRTSDNSFVAGKTYYLPPFVITPTGGENPKAMKWLELQSTNTYIYSTDTIVDSSKNYYNCDIIFGGNYSQTAKGYFSHSEGNYTIANGNYAHTEGQKTKAEGSSSHAEGYNSATEGSYSHAEGNSTRTTGEASHAEGKSTVALGDYSHAEGYSTTASGGASHAEGQGTTASGSASHAEGSYTCANEDGSHAEGYSETSSYNLNRTVEGLQSATRPIAALGVGSHAEGCVHKGGRTSDLVGAIQANGEGSHAEGYSNMSSNSAGAFAIIASGKGAHAEGYGMDDDILAIGDGAHAEGSGTRAIGNYSHAEGDNTEANGEGSHAEGYSTVAYDDYSHAEGEGTTAQGKGSHAEGKGTGAIGDYSHAGGADVMTSYPCQLAQGGSNYKFGNPSYGNGVFCVSPDTLIHLASGTTVDAVNGVSGTHDGGDITLTLDKCAMYMLYHTIYNGTNVTDSGVCLISTPATNGSPYVKHLEGNIIGNVGLNFITLYDANKYMFHLVRII